MCVCMSQGIFSLGESSVSVYANLSVLEGERERERSKYGSELERERGGDFDLTCKDATPCTGEYSYCV